MALTFHGGYEVIGYEWGADSYNNTLSPDDEAQKQLATAYSDYGGSWSGTPPYPFGPMDQTVYTVKGGMEDWAYAGSWDPDKVVACNPITYGGYPAEKATYNNSTLRAFNMLVEASKDKIPNISSLGTSFEILNSETQGNGHVSRNIRLSLLSADLVQPYLYFVGVNDFAPLLNIVPLAETTCKRMNSIRIPQTLNEVVVEWTVGGALEIDETAIYYGNWSDVVSQVDCLTQPTKSLESSLVAGTMLTASNGTGYFSRAGASPSPVNTNGDSPLGPVFRATIDLASFGMGDEIIVMAKARVDQSWLEQPSGIVPQVPPQSHMVNARTDSSWFHESNGKVIEGRLDWYTTIPLTLIISNTTDLVTSGVLCIGVSFSAYLATVTFISVML